MSVPIVASEQTRAERELEQVVSELNKIEGWLGQATDRLSRLQSDLKQADVKIADVSRAIMKASIALAEAEQSIADLELDQQRLVAQRIEQAQQIARHLRQAYRLSGRDFFKMLLNQEDPDTFDRMIRYHGYFSEARAQALREYRETLVALDETASELTRQRDQIVLQQRDLEKQHDELDAQRSERRDLIATLQTEVSDKTVLRDKLAGDRERLQALIAELQRSAREVDGSTFTTAKGSLNWPVEGALLHRFGESRAGGRLTWEGVYFTAPAGTRIAAVASGRVVFADWLRGFGLLTIIDHGNQHMSLYGHCDALYKRTDDWVESGETVAAVGQSGGQPEIGLYFEVRTQGRPTDPLAWLAKR